MIAIIDVLLHTLSQEGANNTGNHDHDYQYCVHLPLLFHNKINDAIPLTDHKAGFDFISSIESATLVWV